MARVAVRPELGTIVATGVAAGLIFAVFEVAAAAALGGLEAATMPLRMIGAIVLGAEALDPSYSLVVAALTGVVVHMVLSVIFVGVFAFLVTPLLSSGGMAGSTGSLALAGVAFGTALWLANFYLIAPAAGWAWFPEQTDPIVQFLAHAMFFGAPAGWMLGRDRPVVGPTL